MIKGSLVALITPFKNGQVDYEALESLIEFHIANGTDGLVPCGTTGESATLTHKEHIEIVDFVVKKVKGRIPVIAGTGSNSTHEAIELGLAAKKSGADAHLSIVPYYNKPTQEGLYQHFKKIAEEVDLPMILYNVPGRTALNMTAETVGRLSKIKNIIGIKEATGDLRQATEIMENVSSGFLLLSGDDFVNLPLLSVGGVGAISVTANIIPKEVSSLFKFYWKGEFEKARSLNLSLYPVNRMMFVETNPIPVKTAAYHMGLIPVLEFRLPLCPMKKENEEKLKSLLKERGLIK
ncbi:MAG: 4-hydroxy-tetrahydrodipicolinate synthase [Brevinematia bacterium]